MKIALLAFILSINLQLLQAQEIGWFRTKYFNQGMKTVFKDNPFEKLPTNENEFLPIIEVSKYGITVYNQNGPSNFSINTGKFLFANGDDVRESHVSVSSERQPYSVEFEKPYGSHRGLYDTICYVNSPTVGSAYFLTRISPFGGAELEIDKKISLKITQVEIIKSSEIVNRFKDIHNIILVDGIKFYLGDNVFTLKIIRGTKSSRHYVIEDNGCELIVKQNGTSYSCLVSFTDGGIVRFHGGQ